MERRPFLAGDLDTDSEVAVSSVEEPSHANRTEGGNICYNALFKRSRTLTLVICILLLSIFSLIIALICKQKSLEARGKYVVKTECGEIEGARESRHGATALVFKGIPYARPPVKDYRWKPPKPVESKTCWEGTLQAKKFRSSCSQVDLSNGFKETGSEDCLFLNVWTPKVDQHLKLPVMVWIHGGYLTSGSSSDPGYSPNVEFVTDMNIVAVSMNYRLNAFGFLTLSALTKQSQSHTSGNYGFMDQILALRWVKHNINRFGGDPNQVTIVGQSSGGTSIYGLLASRQANGLFERAIAMSGSAVFNKTAKEASRDNEIFLKKSNCNKATDKEILDCIYKLNQTEVLKAVPWKQYPYWEMGDLLDLPTKDLFDGALCVVDGDVVRTPPGMLNTYTPMPKRIEVLIGTTSQEIDILPVRDFRNKSLSDFVDFAKTRLAAFSPKLPKRAIDLYKTMLNSSSPHLLYATIASDIRVTCPNDILSANLSMAANLDIYRYVVTNKPSAQTHFFPNHMSSYSAHMWDSSALFGFDGMPINYVPGQRDMAFKEVLRKEFLHFFKHGRPSMPHWKTYPVGTGVFGNDGLIVMKDYHKNGCKLWNEFNLFPYGWIN